MSRVCELVVAAGAGDLGGVRKAIEKGARVADGNYDKRTALHTASAEGKIPVVRRLVEEMGAKINAKDRWEGTPLDDAIRGGHKAVSEFLMAKGAVSGKTMCPVEEHRLVFNAVIASQTDCLKSLMRRKVDINMTDTDKRTALHIACACGDLGTVKCLVNECGANVNAEDRMGGRPIDDCLRCGHGAIADFMRAKGAMAGKAIVNTEAAAALCDAASKGDIDKLRELRDAGIDVNCGDYDMRTAMHLAASEGILPVIEVLVNELGGNQNVTDRWGGTPLDDAVRSQHMEIREWLECNNGVRGAQAMFATEAELLCDAAAKGDTGLFRGLSKQNADINASNLDMRTALHISAAEGFLDAVKVLVEELGAKVNPQDRWGQTPLDDAVLAGNTEVVAYLKEQKASPGKKPVLNGDSDFLIEAATTGDVENVRKVMQVDRDINAANFDQRTALHVASAMGFVDIVQVIISEYGGNVNAKDVFQGTPLDDAIDNENADIVELLEANGGVRVRTMPKAEAFVAETPAEGEAAVERAELHRRSSRAASDGIGGVFAMLCQGPPARTDAEEEPVSQVH